MLFEPGQIPDLLVYFDAYFGVVRVNADVAAAADTIARRILSA